MSKNIGTVTQVIGPVLDIRFADNRLFCDFVGGDIFQRTEQRIAVVLFEYVVGKAVDAAVITVE